MEQQTAAFAASTLPRHALRVLLLVGGAVVWWLVFLSGGAAHADDRGIVGEAGSTSVQEPVAAAHLPGLVDHATHRVSGSLRESPAFLTSTLTGEAASSPAPVVATVQSLTTVVDPRLSLATAAVADRLDSTVDRAEAVLTPTLHRVGLAAPREASTTRIATAVGSPQVSLSSAPGHTVGGQPAAPSAQPVEAVGHPVAGTPTNDRDGLPTGPVPTAPALPGTGSAGGPASAALFGVLVLMLPVRRIRRLSDVTEVGSGPAFPPGSSPD